EGNDLPEHMERDSGLGWKARRRLAEIGGTDRAYLDAALAAEPTGAATVHHARAVASLPTVEAKDFAWARATGAISVSNYEIEAAGIGLWRPDQHQITEPYAAAYFDRFGDLITAHQGWVQAVVVEAFFPITHLEETTVLRTQALLDGDLPGAVRRRLTDRLDELTRRRAVLAR
ncbi:MAG: aminopeptidase N, partial [Nocardioidaceae bacterium]|nr:aminopeptidase N [Nocardioidaceae bacterium]